MIKFDKLWVVMEQKGVTTYALREKGGIDSKTIRRLRNNENMETKTLDKLCKALDCKLEDIAEYIAVKMISRLFQIIFLLYLQKEGF